VLGRAGAFVTERLERPCAASGSRRKKIRREGMGMGIQNCFVLKKGDWQKDKIERDGREDR
jgi:hypothetical protein